MIPCDQQANPCTERSNPAKTGDVHPEFFQVRMLYIKISGMGQKTAVSLTPDATGKLSDHAEKANAIPAKVAAQSEFMKVRANARQANAANPGLG